MVEQQGIEPYDSFLARKTRCPQLAPLKLTPDVLSIRRSSNLAAILSLFAPRVAVAQKSGFEPESSGCLEGRERVERSRDGIHRPAPHRLASNPKFCEPDTSRVYSSPKSGHLLRRTCLSVFWTELIPSLRSHTTQLRQVSRVKLSRVYAETPDEKPHNFHPSRGDIASDVACVAKVEPIIRIELIKSSLQVRHSYLQRIIG